MELLRKGSNGSACGGLGGGSLTWLDTGLIDARGLAFFAQVLVLTRSTVSGEGVICTVTAHIRLWKLSAVARRAAVTVAGCQGGDVRAWQLA